MKTFIVFVDKLIYRNRQYRFSGYQTITKRLEITAQNIGEACEIALRQVENGTVSMVWPKWFEKKN